MSEKKTHEDSQESLFQAGLVEGRSQAACRRSVEMLCSPKCCRRICLNVE